MSNTTTLPERILTVRQPWADLIMAGVKDVENRSWPVPSTLPEWRVCRAADGARDLVDDPNWPLSPCCVKDGPFPFTLGIHAAQKIDPHYGIEGWKALGRAWTLGPINTQATARDHAGYLLGTVTVTGCHHADECRSPVKDEDGTRLYCSRWAEPDWFHWTLVNPVPLDEPVPMKGRLGLWRTTKDSDT